MDFEEVSDTALFTNCEQNATNFSRPAVTRPAKTKVTAGVRIYTCRVVVVLRERESLSPRAIGDTSVATRKNRRGLAGRGKIFRQDRRTS